MNKLCSLEEAIRQYVKNGNLVYAAGFTHLIPFAAGHEIIRQGRKNLTLLVPRLTFYMNRWQHPVAPARSFSLIWVIPG